MDRTFQCPSCGAEQEVTNPGISMKVCDYCHTSMYWDKESVLRTGWKSIELPPSSRFKVGMSGKIGGKSFHVLGRLAYSHDQGSWNEWFIEMQDGAIMWLSEDEGELFLEKPLDVKTELPRYEDLEPGMKIDLDGRIGIVEELGEAKCEGGEGQIPFQIEIGEIYPYVDGSTSDGKLSFGLEYDTEGGNPTAFIGKILAVKDSKVEKGGAPGQAVRHAEGIRCPNCGAPYDGPRLESTEMVVCRSCGSTLELEEAEAKVVGQNRGKEPDFTFKVGDPITIEGISYEVMGRLFYIEEDEGIQYPSMEYVLYEPDLGYLWLSEEDGHFTISRPIHGTAHFPPIGVPKQNVRVGVEVFQFFEWGNNYLRWVDGALPWTATHGELTRYKHAIKPPEYVDQEITGRESELFRGRYVSHDEMTAAAPADVNLPEPQGVYSCQPYVKPESLKGLSYVGLVFLLLNLALFIYSVVGEKAKTVLTETIPFSRYSKEHITKSFVVEEDNTVLRLKGRAPLSNSWLALDFAVMDSQDRVLSEFYDEASYYHGRDSEGYWTEGSQSFSENFMIREAGDYRLLVHGQGGAGYQGPARKEKVVLTIESDVTISWYFIFPIILSLLIVLSAPFHRWLFETRRWRSVMEDAYGDDD